MGGGAGVVERPVAAVDAGVSRVLDRRQAVGIRDRRAAAAVVSPVASPGRLIKSGSGAVRACDAMGCAMIRCDSRCSVGCIVGWNEVTRARISEIYGWN